MGFRVSGKVAPETEKPVPLTVAALMVTAAVPVEDRVTDWVAGEPTNTSPNEMLVALILSVDTPGPNCNVKVCAVPLALAVKVTVAEVLTAEIVAVKLPVVDPLATVTEAGTVTAELLLARLTLNPPLPAVAFNVTVQLSVSAPVIDPLVQFNALSPGTPFPLRLITVDVPVEELLVRVSEPVAAPPAVGSNCTVNVAV